MTSTTPDRQVPPCILTPKGGVDGLQSTPQSLGSAARGKDLVITGVKANDVHPWIARDIKDAEMCEMDLMLQSFILDCMAEDRTMEDAAILFERCLNCVLPICNGESMYGNPKEIREQLAAYCTAKCEIESYPHFTRAANKALFCLRDLSIDGLRDAPKEHRNQLYFHVGRKGITQLYQEQRSIRKPDVVLVSAADFSCDDATDSYCLDVANTMPKDTFKWRNIRAAVEFKYKTGLKGPPTTYTVQYTTPTAGDQHPSQSSIDGIETKKASLVTCSLQDSEPQSGRESGSAVPQSSQVTTGNKRKVNSLESGCQSQDALGMLSNRKSRSHSKRLKVENDEAEPKKADPTVQVGTYGAEMFTSHIARQHVICLLVTGCDVTVWRYDRQSAIKTSKLNFIQDLPRFLVLLLAMQWFNNHNWGLHPKIDSHFGDLSRSSLDSEVAFRDPEKGLVILDCSPTKRLSHYGLNGRATNLCSASVEGLGLVEDLVAKLYWGEESRTSEAEILHRVNEIADMEPDVKDHVPEMVATHKYSDSSTSWIRGRLKLSAEGARVLYVIVFKKLVPITTLHGDEFLTCWWQTVKCHLALWRHGIYHRDVSASNLMSKSGKGGPVGVLNDFDLSTVEGSVRGNERTGTVPFMAIELLSKQGLAGKVSHRYEHDLESFLWVLLWICLRYDKGKIRDVANRPFDEWVKVDAVTCGEKKRAFLTTVPPERPGEGYESTWLLAYLCLRRLRQHHEWPESPPQSGYAAPSKPSFQEIFVKPYNNLLKEPMEEVALRNPAFVELPPPCNFSEITAVA